MAQKIARGFVPFAFVIAACTSMSSPVPVYQRPPSKELRASLVKVGVVSLSTTPKTNFVEPNKFFGSEALQTRRDPYHGGLVLGGEDSRQLGASAVLGDSYALDKPLSIIDLKAIEASLHEDIAGRESQDGLRKRVFAHAADNWAGDLVDLGFAGVSSQPAIPECASSPGSNVTTELEVSLLSVTMTSIATNDPYIGASITTRVRLIRASDCQVLWSNEQFDTSIGVHRLSEWQARDGALLKKATDDALDTVAEKIVYKIFVE